MYVFLGYRAEGPLTYWRGVASVRPSVRPSVRVTPATQNLLDEFCSNLAHRSYWTIILGFFFFFSIESFWAIWRPFYCQNRLFLTIFDHF